ncbi:signal transduction histidine kinase [Kitasatospora gansuensis]|uniref:histidine kinase n=1 Tax=Kitasatospora gansuensis TaxID=258050 RepID=A0A7W7SK85_9ACTN|nr:histidine kinase [Kitasatospora gansuensis]MBB4951428.1 signal transduction histidine kinase [Kitasatospora gansuensis]
MIITIRPWLRRHPRAVDVTLAVVLWGLAVLASSMSATDPRIIRAPSPAVALIAAAASVALLWHRTHPRTVVAVTTMCGAGISALAEQDGFQPSPFTAGAALAALYSMAMRTDRRTAMLHTVAVAGILFAATVLSASGSILTANRIGLIAWILLSGALADSVRSRRDYVAAVEARAELAERTREDEAQRRVGEERLRIARELHDIVAHHIALAHAQAATAAYLLRSKPEQAQQMLDGLAGTTSAALRELQATVGLLRRSDDPEAPLEPAPGLAQLPDLLAAFEGAGLTVSVQISGEPRPLSPGVDLTAYRIVQEALTNVTKHAGTATASVRLAYTRRLLTVTVSDDGPPAAPAGPPGYGLIGMRERAQSVGGRLLAGRGSDGGFQVTTELPLETGESEPDRDDEERSAR